MARSRAKRTPAAPRPVEWEVHGDRQSVADLVAVLFGTLRPPSTAPVSEWVEANRELPGETSAEPGRYDVSRAAYQRAPLDAIGDESVREITLMWGSQLGKSEVKLSGLAWFMSEDPCPILDVEPTQADAEAVSKERIQPMIRNCKALRGRVKDSRSRDSENTILTKRFPGGHLAITASHSPAGLCSRPRRVVAEDEVDRFPLSAGAEGDPCGLAEKRASTFWNRKIIRSSSPTVQGESRIERYYAEGTQERYEVPCPCCSVRQPLAWGQVRWSKDQAGHVDLGTVHYECRECGKPWTEEQKADAVRAGAWAAEHPERTEHRSFCLSSLYSPWVTLRELVTEWLAAQDDTERLRVFVNTRLAETFEEHGEAVDELPLYERRETYDARVEIPAGVVVLTAAVDTQDDRLELEIKGWGRGRESWSLEYLTLQGDPSIVHGTPDRPSVWDDLAALVEGRRYRHPSGATLRVAAIGVDSGGHHTDAVYQFCSPRWAARWWCLKGANNTESPIWPGRDSKAGHGAKLYMVGSNNAKNVIHSDLSKAIPGPGYVHHPDYPLDFFRQLTAEQRVTRRRNGRPFTTWTKRGGRRNEALDLHVYNLAVLEGLHVDLDALADSMGVARTNAAAVSGSSAAQQPQHPQQPRPSAQPRQGFRRRRFTIGPRRS